MSRPNLKQFEKMFETQPGLPVEKTVPVSNIVCDEMVPNHWLGLWLPMRTHYQGFYFQ